LLAFLPLPLPCPASLALPLPWLASVALPHPWIASVGLPLPLALLLPLTVAIVSLLLGRGIESLADATNELSSGRGPWFLEGPTLFLAWPKNKKNQ
jgi:hypothetical protein